jgi:transposase
MDFRRATDELCAAITHDDIAMELGVSVQSIRQARMNRESNGQRSPPDHWKGAVSLLAEKRIAQLRSLIERLRTNGDDYP